MPKSKKTKKLKSKHSNPSSPNLSEKRFSIAPKIQGEQTYALEANILNIEGFLFDLTRKHSALNSDGSYTDTFTDQEGNIVTILWHPKYGRPATTAHKVLQSLFLLSTDGQYPFKDAVTFHQNDIHRLTNECDAGRAHKDLYRALKQLQNTTITYAFYNKTLDKTVVADVKVIGSMFTVRDDKNVSKMEKALVYWDQLIVDSMNADYWSAFNWSRMEGLDAVQSILYKRIFQHFANTAGGKISSLSKSQQKSPAHIKACLNTPFQKDLSDIFDFWLGRLKQPKYKSQIIREYGPRLDGLKRTGLIRSWKIEKQKSKPGYKLVASRGLGFVEDYLNFYFKDVAPNSKPHSTVSDDLNEPIDLLIHFYTKRFGKNAPEEFTTKEVAVAKKLIKKHGLSGSCEFVDFGIERALKDKFDVLYLKGLTQYEPVWLSSRALNNKREEERKRKECEENLKSQYDDFCKSECSSWFSKQSKREQGRLSSIATEKAMSLGNNSHTTQTFHGMELRKLIKKQISLPSFSEWKRQQS